MPHRSWSPLIAVVVVATQIATGCDGAASSAKEQSKPEKPAEQPNSAGKTNDVVQDTKKSHAETPATDDEKAVAKPASSTSADRKEPAWFTPELYPGATVNKQGRSETTDSGGYSSMLLLALPAGTTVESCVSTFKDRVKDQFPELSEKPNGERIEVRGKDQAGNETVLICGDVKGTMTAFVSYVVP